MKVALLKEDILKQMLQEDLDNATRALKRMYRELELAQRNVAAIEEKIKIAEAHVAADNLHLVI